MDFGTAFHKTLNLCHFYGKYVIPTHILLGFFTAKHTHKNSTILQYFLFWGEKKKSKVNISDCAWSFSHENGSLQLNLAFHFKCLTKPNSAIKSSNQTRPTNQTNKQRKATQKKPHVGITLAQRQLNTMNNKSILPNVDFSSFFSRKNSTQISV